MQYTLRAHTFALDPAACWTGDMVARFTMIDVTAPVAVHSQGLGAVVAGKYVLKETLDPNVLTQFRPMLEPPKNGSMTQLGGEYEAILSIVGQWGFMWQHFVQVISSEHIRFSSFSLTNSGSVRCLGNFFRYHCGEPEPQNFDEQT